MKRAFLLGIAGALLASAAWGAEPLSQTFATLDQDIVKNGWDRRVPHLASQSKSAPVQDGTIGADEYTWSQLVVDNGAGNATLTNDGSDGYGDCAVSGTNTAPDSPTDLSFTVYLAHDDTYLYAAVRVIDDILVNQDGAVNAQWHNDCIEFTIDADDTRNGRRTSVATPNDRPGLAGGRVDFDAFADGDETAADINLLSAAATSYGPTFTLYSGLLGRALGVDEGANVNDEAPNPNPLTDIHYYMKCDNRATNGNRSFELRIPKTALSYSLTGKQNPDSTHAGTFTNGIIGLQVALDDNDTADIVRDHQMFMDNAGENLDGTDVILNADGTQWGTGTIGANLGTTNWDAVNIGVRDQFAHGIEACWPRFQLLASPAANHNPAFTSDPIAKPLAAVGVAYSDSLAGDATDADAIDILTFAKVSGPSWLTVGQFGELSGMPSASDMGNNAFTVSVSDGVVTPPVTATLNIEVVGTLPSAARTWIQYDR